MNILKIIGRDYPLISDIPAIENELYERISASSFIVIGGAGSIGQAVTKELFLRNPKKLLVVDLSENNLVELVRDLRSSLGYIRGDFRTFAIDCGSLEFEILFQHEGPFDYVLNLSALKHVRSEKDIYTLMRMLEVNILNTIHTIKLSIEADVKKYFCVSTDKAANPVNMMGASKRIMEMFLLRYGNEIAISTARFANVAFSDGSLLHGFEQRLMKDQPIAAPSDVRRYFMASKEAGEICIASTILGNNREIFFPKPIKDFNVRTFPSIAREFLFQHGYEAVEYDTEEEARSSVCELKPKMKWPCYFSVSDTTGEKDQEEFYIVGEEVDLTRFESLGVVLNSASTTEKELAHFLQQLQMFRKAKQWTKEDILNLFVDLLPNFAHIEKGKHLDTRM
jgi:nucleoside-diphosphate-sugar epimerase